MQQVGVWKVWRQEHVQAAAALKFLQLGAASVHAARELQAGVTQAGETEEQAALYTSPQKIRRLRHSGSGGCCLRLSAVQRKK